MLRKETGRTKIVLVSREKTNQGMANLSATAATAYAKGSKAEAPPQPEKM